VIVVPETIPSVDTSKHSVPLEEIYFDTFQPENRAVPLSQADPEQIESLRDAIPPIHNPKYETAEQAAWLDPDDTILGYTAGNQAWAYPTRILNFHEIVNDNLEGEPVLVSYCPLCFSGIVYSRRLDDRVLLFGNTSALYESDLIMLDYDTGSYWWQVAGEAIVGPLTGVKLTVLPSSTTSWEDWRERHPQTWVLSRDTGFSRDYSRDIFGNYISSVNNGRFAFPVSEASLDSRLLPGAKVLALKIEDVARAYPLDLDKKLAVRETVSNQEIVVFIDPDAPTGSAFDPASGDGRQLSFSVDNNEFIDAETGSTWDISGKAINGPLAGTQLAPLPTKTTLWFAIVGAEPDISLYQP